jgi:hypothetical protein
MCWDPKLEYKIRKYPLLTHSNISVTRNGYVLHSRIEYWRKYPTKMMKLLVVWNSNYTYLFGVMLWLCICKGRPMDIININHFAQLDVIPVPSPCSGSRKKSMTKGTNARVCWLPGVAGGAKNFRLVKSMFHTELFQWSWLHVGLYTNRSVRISQQQTYFSFQSRIYEAFARNLCWRDIS